MNFIEKFINSITIYRLILYYLIGLLVVALVFSALGILPFGPVSLILSTFFVIFACLVTNKIFSKSYNAPTNVESVYISALLLALIISPAASSNDIWVLFWAGILAMASKYILALNKKHIFNPVAIAVVLTSVAFNGAASWWVGTFVMLPFVLAGGILTVSKFRRWDMVLGFFTSALITTSVFSLLSGQDIFLKLQHLVLDSPFLFLAFVMLTEPLTTPSTNRLQTIYGSLAGFLFAPQIHLGNLFSTPELALVFGNIFSYIVSPKYKVLLRLKDKTFYGADIVDFQFQLDKKLNFSPGQYMEWTLPHKKPDNRGNRRYFTIASSPTENMLKLGIKFYAHGSTFKKKLDLVDKNTPFIAGQLTGNFTLPKDTKVKCVFIAGGIGITPYRSMIKYLIDTKQSRPITLFYSNKEISEIAYSDVFEQARKELSIKTVYTLTDTDKIPSGWPGKVGRVDAQMIKDEVPNYMESKYYLSGPFLLVKSFEKTLKEMGVRGEQIKKDYFPGFV